MHGMKDIKKVQVSTCEVRYKNECHMVSGPVLGHIKILGQIQPLWASPVICLTRIENI